MKWRAITEDEVTKTVQDPENVGDSLRGRKNAYNHIDGKWLKVTFREESDKIIIITVIDKGK